MGLALARIIPVATTFAVTMCHFDQYLIFSSFLSSNASPQARQRVLPHMLRSYVQGALPIIIVLEFVSYGAFAANVYYRLPLWKWYAGGLVCFLSHLFNAPYSWKLLTAIMQADEGAHKEEKQDIRPTLEKFVRMNKLRLILTELPLICIVLGGSLIGA
ncbi:hypothetical protein F4804DRAFT_58501 [Jackrogersella minutella]|nr:hypothetical protein F4804DRAFT_58501 [Jackrogersella minutella]